MSKVQNNQNAQESNVVYKPITPYDIKDQNIDDIFFKNDKGNMVELNKVDNRTLLLNYNQLYLKSELTWQERAMLFISKHPQLSQDKFIEDLFSNEYPEMHEGLLKLCYNVVKYHSGDKNE